MNHFILQIKLAPPYFFSFEPLMMVDRLINYWHVLMFFVSITNAKLRLISINSQKSTILFYLIKSLLIRVRGGKSGCDYYLYDLPLAPSLYLRRAPPALDSLLASSPSSRSQLATPKTEKKTKPSSLPTSSAAAAEAAMAAAAVATVSSASGILAMLQEPAEELKLHALASLNSVVHLFYPEISTSIPTM